MTRRSKPSNASDPIEQYTATQPITARATPSKSSPRDRVSRRLQVPLLRLHECLRALNPTLLRAGRPSSNVDPMTTTQHSEHSRRQPSGQPPGAWGSVVYEHSSRPPPLAIWLRQVTGENVDSEGLPRPMTSSTAVEEAHERHLVERVADYIRYISHDKLSTVRAKSLDCTFCGLLFPPYLPPRRQPRQCRRLAKLPLQVLLPMCDWTTRRLCLVLRILLLVTGDPWSAGISSQRALRQPRPVANH